MAFCGEMHHDVRPKLLDDRAYGRSIANINLRKTVALLFRHAGEIVEVARIGELVDDADLMPRVLNEVTHHCGANETGAAGNKKSLASHGALNTRMGKRMS
jgi:hypothetical protein